MPRAAREKSSTGIYHIILRGINRQNIFEDEEDAIRLLETIESYKEKCGYEIYAYCFMGNHIHLLIKEGKEELGIVFRRIGASYVYWYNWKYKRCGHLFQDRYKSEPIEDDTYFSTVLRYIHRNPLKANIVKDIEKYKWSSYNEYVNEGKICKIDYALKIFSENNGKAKELFKAFIEEENDDKCLEISDEYYRLTDEETKKIISRLVNVKNASDFQRLEIAKRNKHIKKLLKKGISTRQLSRLTGISRSIILKYS